MKRRIFSILLCCIMMFSLCSQIVLAEGQGATTCEHDYSQEVVSPDALKQEGNCVFRAEYYYSCSICGEVEKNDDHIFYGSRDFDNHKGPKQWLITDKQHKFGWTCCGRWGSSYEDHQMGEGICTKCGYISQCVHANEDHDEKCDYCGVMYINPEPFLYYGEGRSGDVLPIRYFLRGEEREGDWYECSLIDRQGTIIKKENGNSNDPSWGEGWCNMLIPENLEDDAYFIRVSLMRNDETEGAKEIWRSEVWVILNSEKHIYALDKTVEYSSGLVYDVGELFFCNRTLFFGGLEQYSLVGGTGEGTLNGTYLAVTKPGTFIVKASIPPVPELRFYGGEATATLTVTCGHKDENKDHNCDYGCTEAIGEHKDDNNDHACDYGCSIPICDHEEIGESHICMACGQPICCRTCNKPFSFWRIDIYPTCESAGMYTAIDCNGNVITVELRSLGHLDENNDHICDRVECKKEGICVHNGTVNAYQTCDYCGEHVCPKCKTSQYIPLIDTSYHAVQATCEEDGSWEITCDRPSCKNAGGTFSGTVPALGHKDENKDHNCDHDCGKSDMGEHNDSNNDHACDYGCAKAIGEHKDNNNDHACDYGCAKAIGEHKDNNNDHDCDYGCAVAIGEHKDDNNDHACDYGCAKAIGEHKAADGKHTCDYCGKEMTTCKDENPIDHKCDICDKTISKHTGGEATCISKAICDDCGNEYGEVDSSNHNLEKIPAKGATVTNTGNKEYWHCKDCGKFFADENGTSEIKLNNTVLAKLAPEIIEGMGQSLTAGEKKALTFRSNAAFGDFIRVELDGSTLEAALYTASEGSIIVILKADYAATLSAGTHTIGIVSTSGTAATTFTVTDNAAKSPKTGDNSHMALWIALFFVTGGLLTGTGVYSKKKKRSAK